MKNKLILFAIIATSILIALISLSNRKTNAFKKLPKSSGAVGDSTLVAYQDKHIKVVQVRRPNENAIATTAAQVDNLKPLNAIFDNIFLASKGLNRQGKKVAIGDFVAKIPNVDGTVWLNASTLAKPRTEIMKYANRFIQLDNENNFYYVSDDMLIETPSEDWFVGLDLSGFSYEAYLNVYGKYLGDLGGQFRTTNGNNEFIKGRFPLYKPFVVRLQYTAAGTVKMWLNNIYKGELKTYLYGLKKPFTRIGIGTNTNNSKWLFASILQVNKSLSDEQANEAFRLLSTEYGIGKDLQFPIAKSVDIVFSGKNVIAKYSYYSPTSTPMGAVDVSWYAAGNGQNPDVSNNKLIPELTGKIAFDASEYPAGTWFRCDVKVTDKNGLSFGAGSGCVYKKSK